MSAASGPLDAGARGRSAAWRRVLDFILPAGCVACRRWIPSSDSERGPAAMVCSRCRSLLKAGSWPRCRRCHAPRGTGRAPAVDCLECRDWPDALSTARFAWLLRPPADDLVHALKYEGWRELAGYMGRCMADVAEAEAPADIVVPIPTTTRRMRERGYNQAALLADVVARELDLPRIDALTRRAGAVSQTRLSPLERRENVRDVFATGPEGAAVRGRRALLVDDVLTTGATASAAASALRAMGAGDVQLLTFGRALPGRDAETASAV